LKGKLKKISAKHDRKLRAQALLYNLWSLFDMLGGGVRDVFLDKNFADPTIKKLGLYQEGQGGQRCPFNLKDCLGEIANCQKY
jgi:hypothetical protein